MKMAVRARGIIVPIVLLTLPAFGARLKGSPLLVDGYTDCQTNNPKNQDDWWKQKALGHRKALTNNPSYSQEHYQVPGRKVAMCLPAKNGCTYWKALFMRMLDNPNWNSPEEDARHNVNKTKLEHTWHVFDEPDALALMLVRNPVVRVLSAFLDKKSNTSGYYKDLLRPYGFDKSGFEKFVKDIVSNVQAHSADGHWRRQSDTCGLPEGATWDYYLKVECRALWGPAFFKKYDLSKWTDSGWGSDGQQPFISAGQGAPAPTEIQGIQHNDRWGTHSHRADKMLKVCKWYTEANFLNVVSLYAQDIISFGYFDDVRRLAQECGFRIPSDA